VRSVGNGFGNGEFDRRPSGLVPVIRRGVVSRMNAALHALVLVCHSPKQRNSAPSFVCVVTKSMVFQQKTRHPPSETVRAKRVSNHVGVNGLKTLGRWLRCHGEGTSKCELRADFSSVTDCVMVITSVS
jgi:hypothetical protein